jgi:hypothetical protein
MRMKPWKTLGISCLRKDDERFGSEVAVATKDARRPGDVSMGMGRSVEAIDSNAKPGR